MDYSHLDCRRLDCNKTILAKIGPQDEVGSMIWVPGVGLQGPRGSRGRPIQGPRGSKGRPTWSNGVKGGGIR